MIQTVLSDMVPVPVGPYSHGIEYGNFVYTSGQLPVDKETGGIPENAAEQARVSLTNLKHVLEQAGSDLEKVVKVTVFLSNMDDFTAVNEVYAGFFSTPFPARSCIEVSRLPLDVLVEVEAVAVK
ncbi:MAG: Rid family detoxifying hydrolase [Desulfuromusa sp.]|nr:Rid family detoxifying hydrolase [Desulfuromusa sp.]